MMASTLRATIITSRISPLLYTFIMMNDRLTYIHLLLKSIQIIHSFPGSVFSAKV